MLIRITFLEYCRVYKKNYKIIFNQELPEVCEVIDN